MHVFRAKRYTPSQPPVVALGRANENVCGVKENVLKRLKRNEKKKLRNAIYFTWHLKGFDGNEERSFFCGIQ